MENYQKPLILVVDDSSYNRDLLTEILEDTYEIVQASDGARALEIMNERRSEISCVLLDLSMAGVNGFDVLEEMNTKHWISSLPVIIISAEISTESIRKGFNLGVSDYILRPYDEVVVKKRVENTVKLYAKQKKLRQMFIDQVHENDKISDMMISILGYTVEFRNKESNSHITTVSILTKILLDELNLQSGKYTFSKKDIALISRAAALHDIGKVSIPDEILNKPGRLTPEEFEKMKSHSAIGGQMLESITEYQDEPLVKIAYKICRWHHERYDGKGYPDGLAGDKIPIEAQVVSLADVYDALTSERCYKKAFTHEKAIDMIKNNECGTFNPDLIECLVKIQKDLPLRVIAEFGAKKRFQVYK